MYSDEEDSAESTTDDDNVEDNTCEDATADERCVSACVTCEYTLTSIKTIDLSRLD